MKTLFLILLVALITYLIYLLLKPKKANLIDPEVLEKFPELEIDLKELAEKTWLKYDDKMYHEYVEAVSKVKTVPLETISFTRTQTVETEPVSSEESDNSETVPFTIKDEVISSLWRDCIEPYLQVMKEQKALPLIVEGLKTLSEKGDCPSVSVKIRQDEFTDETDAKDYALYRDLLAKTTLKEHTAHVVRYAVDTTKSIFKSPETHLPKVITVSIYHDIGKIPEFKTLFGNQAHPYASGDYLSQVAKKVGETPFWIDEAIQIVKEHHVPGEQNVYKKILREADKSARMLEIATKLSGYTVKKFEEWFSIDEFLKKLSPLINDDRFGNKWYAFSFKSVVYLRPDRMIDLVEQMRQEKKVISPELLTEEDKERIRSKIIQMLSEQNKLAHSSPDKVLKKPLKFTILLRDGRSYSYYLVPIKLTSFPEEDIKAIEGRKAISNLAGSIAGIRPGN